jgi:hypothetical protein
VSSSNRRANWARTVAILLGIVVALVVVGVVLSQTLRSG